MPVTVTSTPLGNDAGRESTYRSFLILSSNLEASALQLHWELSLFILGFVAEASTALATWATHAHIRHITRRASEKRPARIARFSQTNCLHVLIF